jgi:asparagine synthetase B (glutamine-hydrolysing)
MSKILYVCYRSNQTTISPVKLQKICNELEAKNIDNKEPFIYGLGNIGYGITNPGNSLRRSKSSVLLGEIFGNDQNWNEIGNQTLDGNFAIFRSNKKYVEIKTDFLGTRSIWYYYDEKIIIASTSQKAIISYLGNFEFNKDCIPWIISTGSLGPGHSWDKRIKKVPADGSIIINKNNWSIKTITNEVEFNTTKYSLKESRTLLRNTLLDVFKSINLDFEKWPITLSGGHDSRSILLLFKKSKEKIPTFKTITWAAKNRIIEKNGDAYIANRVSEVLETNHQLFNIELSPDSLNSIINNFLHLGEGRIDHITAYLDNFQLWKRIYDSNIEGLIRGDEVFGWNKIYSPLIVKSSIGLTLIQDYSNLNKYEFLNSLQQEIPEGLNQGKNESISTWRDRVYQKYRIPYIQSALGDLKYSYVEQINPYLSKKIVQLTRTMPDNLRTDKRLFKQVMKELAIDVPFAQRDSTLDFKKILREETSVNLLKDELQSEYARKIFPESFLNQVINNLKIAQRNPVVKKGIRNKLISLVPLKLKKFVVQNKTSLNLDENLLAFRILIICRMHKELSKNI